MTKSALAHAANTAVESPATVHVLDDDVSLRDALDLLLPSVGLEVRTYASVQEFLDAKAHHKPSCIVLDVRLPGITGLDFQSRCDAFGVHLPIVMMTGHSDVPMSVQAMKAGAIDFLPKPFRDQDMIDAVMAAIARDRQRRTADGAAADIGDRYASSLSLCPAELSPRGSLSDRLEPRSRPARRGQSIGEGRPSPTPISCRWR
jgi:FixJ family two-component response regulator